MGRNWLRVMKAVASPCHQKLKFPSTHGVVEVRGSQHEVRYYFGLAIQVVIIKNREEAPVFTWQSYDIPTIDAKVMCHKVPIDPNFKPMRQKLSKASLKKAQAVEEEVHKVLKAGAIRESKFLDWIFNPAIGS